MAGGGDGLVVGFAGIGRMGLPMARNIGKAGFELLVWNRTADRCAPLVADGAVAVADPAGLAAADVVVTMVADGPAAKAVLVESGLLGALKPGSVVLEMSTIGPAAVAELVAAAAPHGVEIVDAPVSGSIALAEAATLFVMCGGSPEAYAKASPVLDALSKGHVLLGRSGAGAAMKLGVNAGLAVTTQAIAEVLALAERYGIAREAAYDVLASGAMASPFLLYKRAAFVDPEGAGVGFTTRLMRKDMTLAQGLAAEVGARMPATDVAASMLDDAIAAGLAEADIASVLRLLEPGA